MKMRVPCPRPKLQVYQVRFLLSIRVSRKGTRLSSHFYPVLRMLEISKTIFLKRVNNLKRV